MRCGGGSCKKRPAYFSLRFLWAPTNFFYRTSRRTGRVRLRSLLPSGRIKLEMEQRLSDLITLKRRYTRSINLERDLSIVDRVLGYVPTSWTLEACARIFPAFANEHSMKAWTITGVY